MSEQENKGGKSLDVQAWESFKAAGFTEAELQADQPFGPMIHSYTRQQAIEDGTLVDLTADGEGRQFVREAGVKIPVAMTSGAFHESLLAGTSETAAGEFIFPAGQSLKGRLWDVLMVFRMACRAEPDTDRVFFNVNVWDGKRSATVALWALIGPGDQGEPVLTIMLQGED